MHGQIFVPTMRAKQSLHRLARCIFESIQRIVDIRVGDGLDPIRARHRQGDVDFIKNKH